MIYSRKLIEKGTSTMKEGTIITLFKDGRIVETHDITTTDDLLNLSVRFTEIIAPLEVNRYYTVSYGKNTKVYAGSDIPTFILAALLHTLPSTSLN